MSGFDSNNSMMISRTFMWSDIKKWYFICSLHQRDVTSRERDVTSRDRVNASSTRNIIINAAIIWIHLIRINSLAPDRCPTGAPREITKAAIPCLRRRTAQPMHLVRRLTDSQIRKTLDRHRRDSVAIQQTSINPWWAILWHSRGDSVWLASVQL